MYFLISLGLLEVYSSHTVMVTVYSVTVTRSRIEASIPRKHGPAIAGYDKVCS